MIERIRARLGRVVEAAGRAIGKGAGGPTVYDQDGLRSVHDHTFMDDPAFRRAYARGVAAAGEDYGWHWRVHIGLWAARAASRLGGDFVECGVNRGFMSSAIMAYLDWDSLGKTFYLLDTFAGIDARQLDEADLESGALARNQTYLRAGFYVQGSDAVRKNFAEWKHVRIIEGSVPDTLGLVDAPAVAFLHLDMNCGAPEAAAFNFLWERLVPGAIVLCDDYAYRGSRTQKDALDAAAAGKNLAIVSLPTGQGLLIKPALDHTFSGRIPG